MREEELIFVGMVGSKIVFWCTVKICEQEPEN